MAPWLTEKVIGCGLPVLLTNVGACIMLPFILKRKADFGVSVVFGGEARLKVLNVVRVTLYVE